MLLQISIEGRAIQDIYFNEFIVKNHEFEY